MVLQAKACDNLKGLLDMRKLTNLQELNLVNSHFIKALFGLDHLISLPMMVVNLEILEVEDNLHNLTKLVIIDVKGLNKHRAQNVANFVNLEGLTIKRFEGVNVLARLSNLTKLESLF